MMPAILAAMKRTLEEQKISVGKVLEVGSRNVNGTPRSVFQHLTDSYLGIDIEKGDGVDLVLSGEKISSHFPIDSFDTVICCETLEHVAKPWLIVTEIKKVLRRGGYLWVSTPTYGFPLHRFPLDCYRFGVDAYVHWIFEDCDLLALERVLDELQQPALVAAGRLMKQ